MDRSDPDAERKKKVYEATTFPVPFALEEIKEKISISTKTPSKPPKEKIINQAIKFHLEGNISEATKYYQQIINLGFKDQQVFSNYGVILQNLGKLKEAEHFTRKQLDFNQILQMLIATSEIY